MRCHDLNPFLNTPRHGRRFQNSQTLCGMPAVACSLLVLIAVLMSAVLPARAMAAERQVLAVAVCDSYGDLKKQIGWVGAQIDNPGLAGMAESVLLLATQGKGLAGLDVKRPMGIVISSDGTDIAGHGFVPVKDLGKLLDSLQSVIGPSERVDGGRRITLPSGIAMTMTEKDGWAILTPDGIDASIAVDPTPFFAPLIEDFSLGIKVFPSLLPAALREQLAAFLQQGADARGTPLDSVALKIAIEGLAETESLTLGLGIDIAKKRVLLENRTVAVAGSKSALALLGAAGGSLTVAPPDTADGKPAAVRLCVAQSLPPDTQKQALELLQQSLPDDSDNAATKILFGVARDLLFAMLGSGGIDAAGTLDTSATTEKQPLPTITAGARVKDGAAFEKQVKKLLGDKQSVPDYVRVQFDSGKVGAATLHTVRLYLSGVPGAENLGESLDLTLAIAPEYVFLLAGGDPQKRLSTVLESNGQKNPAGKPLATLQLSMDDLLLYAAAQGGGPQATLAAERMRAGGPVPDAEAATDTEAALLQLLVRPIERGLAMRLSAGAGVVRAAATLAGPAQAKPVPVLGGGVPLPRGFPLPLPARR